MPTYSFRNTETGEVTDHFMRMADREQFLKDNPLLVQTFTSPPGAENRFVTTDRMKSPSDYTSLLKSFKKFYPGSSINVR